MKRGFTLIELLVVIAIIAILAAILFPVFAAAKDSAKNTVLLSQSKQLGTASLMYASDYDDLFAPSMASSQEYWIDDAWQILIQPYVKNLNMIRNPKRDPFNNGYLTKAEHFGMPPRAYTASDATAHAQGYFSGTHDGFAIRFEGIAGFVNLNPDWGYDWMGRYYAPSYSTTMIVDPSTTEMLGEANWWDLGFSIVGATDPYGWCMYNDATNNSVYNITGNTCTTKPSSTEAAGVGFCAWQDGRTTIVSCDSSAKSMPWRSNFYGLTAGNNAAFRVSKYMNPLGW